MSEVTQGFLTGVIIVLMGIAFCCAMSKKETELCIWCVGLSLIIVEVIL